VLLGAGAPLALDSTTRVRFTELVCGGVDESVTVTVKEKVPERSGVPAISAFPLTAWGQGPVGVGVAKG